MMVERRDSIALGWNALRQWKELAGRCSYRDYLCTSVTTRKQLPTKTGQDAARTRH